jgi:hypothetical protein
MRVYALLLQKPTHVLLYKRTSHFLKRFFKFCNYFELTYNTQDQQKDTYAVFCSSAYNIIGYISYMTPSDELYSF